MLHHKKLLLCSLLTTMIFAEENTYKTDVEIINEFNARYYQIINDSTEDKAIKILKLQTLLSNIKKERPYLISSICSMSTVLISLCCIIYHSMWTLAYALNEEETNATISALCTAFYLYVNKLAEQNIDMAVSKDGRLNILEQYINNHLDMLLNPNTQSLK